MTDCKEYIREVMAITAIPIGNIDASDAGAIVNVLKPTVSATAVVASGTALSLVNDTSGYSNTSSGYVLLQGSNVIYHYFYDGENSTIARYGYAKEGDIYYVEVDDKYYKFHGTQWGMLTAAPDIVYNNAITIGLKPIDSGVTLIPIKRDTGKAKDDPSDSVAGRGHTVTVNCEVDERGGELWANQLILERTAHHLILTFRDGDKGFVAATEDTYICNVSRDGAKVNVSFRIHNLMGIQILTIS